MNDQARVKVSLNQAAEFAAQGFEVECYVLPGKPAAPAKRKISKRTPNMDPEQKLTLSVEGQPPQFGRLADTWNKLRDHYWANDITKQVTVAKIRVFLDSIDGTSHSDLAKFVNHYCCLRKVG